MYLEGLSENGEAAWGSFLKHIVLDLTNSEKPRDMVHIRNVCEYGAFTRVFSLHWMTWPRLMVLVN